MIGESDVLFHRIIKTLSTKKMKSKTRKAESHLEMIISFSIFLIFLLFLFTFMNPVRKPDLSNVLLDIVEKEMKNSTISLLEMPVVLYEFPSPGTCFSIECPFNLSYVLSGDKRNYIFVKDEQNKDVAFNLIEQGDLINITITVPSDLSSRMYTLYFSDDEFSSSMLGSSSCPSSGQYNFSTPRLKKLYSYSKLKDINTSYYSNGGYDGLKKRFNFPESNDFAIYVRYYFEMSGIKPEKGIVKAREIPIEVLKEEGNQKQIIKTYLNIQVW